MGGDLEATRIRFGSVLEWLLAAALILAALAALAVGSALYRDARTVGPVVPVIAGEPPAVEAPPGLPSRSISVPMLLLGNGSEVRLGDRASDVAARLGGAARLLSESLERSRITRFYDYFGVQFVLVFDALEGTGEPRVAAIYRQ